MVVAEFYETGLANPSTDDIDKLIAAAQERELQARTRARNQEHEPQ